MVSCGQQKGWGGAGVAVGYVKDELLGNTQVSLLEEVLQDALAGFDCRCLMLICAMKPSLYCTLIFCLLLRL